MKDPSRKRSREEPSTDGQPRKKKGKFEKSKVKKKEGMKKCPHCDKHHLNVNKRWSLEKNKDIRPKHWKSKSSHSIQQEIAKDQRKLMIAEAATDQRISDPQLLQTDPARKRKTEWEKDELESKDEKDDASTEQTEEGSASSSSDESMQIGCPMMACAASKDSSDSDGEFEFEGCSSELLHALPFSKRDCSSRGDSKKFKKDHHTAEATAEMEDWNGDAVPIGALSDTGTSSTTVLRDFVQKGQAEGFESHRNNWQTLGGNFKTKTSN